VRTFCHFVKAKAFKLGKETKNLYPIDTTNNGIPTSPINMSLKNSGEE